MFRVAKTSMGGIAALLIAASPATLTAAATAAPSPRSLTVHFADLDLNRPADVAMLYHRIKVAAARVCGPRELGGPHIASTDFYHCVTDTVDRAVSTLDRPVLTAYHQGHGVPSIGPRKIARR
jgi:UrcA family protein